MITIFNKKEGFQISIDDTLPQVLFTPVDYSDIPHIQIVLKGLNFHHHSHTCKDCKAFISSFGTQTLDWFISYSDKVKRLDLSSFSKEYLDNSSEFKISELEITSTLKLNLSKIPDNKQELEKIMQQDINAENYERCTIWRELLKEY